MYSYEDLNALTKDRLIKLAEYTDVPDVNMKMLKGDIIEAIIEHMKPKVAEADQPQMSVRIKRIREQNRS